MDFMVNALFLQNGDIKSGSKRIIVTGIGGCGKTQLVRKFVEIHGDRYVATNLWGFITDSFPASNPHLSLMAVARIRFDATLSVTSAHSMFPTHKIHSRNL
jgi:GTPase SAR1 family protein